MTDKIVDGHAEVVRNAGQNGNVRLGIAVLILVDGLLADLNEISQSALAQTLAVRSAFKFASIVRNNLLLFYVE